MSIDEARNGLSGRHALIGIIAFFGVVFAVNGVMLYYALSTHAGVETPDAYRRGLAYNERIAESERQAQRGWTDAMELERQPTRISVQMTNANGGPVTGLRISGAVGRPATSSFDVPLLLVEKSPGRYEMALEILEPGAWLANIAAFEIESGAERVVYRAKRRLWLKP